MNSVAFLTSQLEAAVWAWGSATVDPSLWHHTLKVLVAWAAASGFSGTGQKSNSLPFRFGVEMPAPQSSAHLAISIRYDVKETIGSGEDYWVLPEDVQLLSL